MKYLLILTVFFSTLGFAQEAETSRKEKKEKIEQLKIAYLTKKLSLSSKEAEKFWPVYNEMQSELSASKKDRRKAMKELKNIDSTATDAQVKVMFEKVQYIDQNELDIKKKYLTKIAEIVGYRRVHDLLEAEHEFKRELLRELRERKGNQQPRRN